MENQPGSESALEIVVGKPITVPKGLSGRVRDPFYTSGLNWELFQFPEGSMMATVTVLDRNSGSQTLDRVIYTPTTPSISNQNQGIFILEEQEEAEPEDGLGLKEGEGRRVKLWCITQLGEAINAYRDLLNSIRKHHSDLDNPPSPSPLLVGLTPPTILGSHFVQCTHNPFSPSGFSQASFSRSSIWWPKNARMMQFTYHRQTATMVAIAEEQVIILMHHEGNPRDPVIRVWDFTPIFRASTVLGGLVNG